MKAEHLAVVQGWDETRATLARWNADPWRTLRTWALGSLAVTGLLLTLTWIVAETTIADPQLHSYPGLTRDATLHDFGFLLYRNGLVLALHALACVAGFIAGSQLPTAAQDYRGLVRKLHEAAGPRRSPSSPPPRCSRSPRRPTRSATAPPRWRSSSASRRSSCWSRCCRTPCPSCSRSSSRWPPGRSPASGARWNELLAATFATTAIAIPLLLLAAGIETWVTPSLLSAIS